MRKSLIILGILEDRDLEWLIENGSGRRLQVGDYLLRQGRTVEAMYFLLAGRLVSSSRSRRLQLMEPESGEVVGEISLLIVGATASVR